MEDIDRQQFPMSREVRRGPGCIDAVILVVLVIVLVLFGIKSGLAGDYTNTAVSIAILAFLGWQIVRAL